MRTSDLLLLVVWSCHCCTICVISVLFFYTLLCLTYCFSEFLVTSNFFPSTPKKAHKCFKKFRKWCSKYWAWMIYVKEVSLLTAFQWFSSITLVAHILWIPFLLLQTVQMRQSLNKFWCIIQLVVYLILLMVKLHWLVLRSSSDLQEQRFWHLIGFVHLWCLPLWIGSNLYLIPLAALSNSVFWECLIPRDGFLMHLRLKKKDLLYSSLAKYRCSLLYWNSLHVLSLVVKSHEFHIIQYLEIHLICSAIKINCDCHLSPLPQHSLLSLCIIGWWGCGPVRG